MIAPGGGFPEKCWGNENYTALTKLLIQNTKVDLCIIGSKEDVSRISVLEKENVRNLCGRLDLREAAALVSTADFVISNLFSLYAFGRSIQNSIGHFAW